MKTYLNLESKRIGNYEPCATPEYEFLVKKMDSKQKQTYCLGRRHMSNLCDVVEYEKVNPKTKKSLELKKENVISVTDLNSKFY